MCGFVFLLIFFVYRLEKLESFQRSFNGKVKWQKDFLIGPLMTRNTWKKSSQMFFSTSFAWLMFVALTLAKQLLPK